MEEYISIGQRLLQQSATIHIYSFPHFVLELCLTSVFLIIYVLLHVEVRKIYKWMIRLKPNTVFCETHSAGTISEDSMCSVTTHYQEIYTVSKCPSTTISYKRLSNNLSTNSQMGWVLPSHPMEECLVRNTNVTEKKRYADQLVALTPEQFVKLDKERKLREKELDSYMTSLSTLCKNVLKKKYSSRTLSRQVEMARENLQCNKMTLEGKYIGFKTEAMTRSLFNMLEQMITNSSLQNPLPFKGDITTLALDVADLSTEGQYFAKNIAKWDTNSSTCNTDLEDIEEKEAIATFKNERWDAD